MCTIRGLRCVQYRVPYIYNTGSQMCTLCGLRCVQYGVSDVYNTGSQMCTIRGLRCVQHGVSDVYNTGSQMCTLWGSRCVTGGGGGHLEGVRGDCGPSQRRCGAQCSLIVLPIFPKTSLKLPSILPLIFPQSPLDVPSMLPQCFLLVEGSLNSSRIFPQCPLSVPSKFPHCPLKVPSLFPEYPFNVNVFLNFPSTSTLSSCPKNTPEKILLRRNRPLTTPRPQGGPTR
jgi:hypothetical protein